MVTTTAFPVQNFPLSGNYELHFGRSSKGFFYEIQDVRYLVNVDMKDNLTKGQFIESVDCAIEQDKKAEFLNLVNSI
jgi:hypothetical protein